MSNGTVKISIIHIVFHFTRRSQVIKVTLTTKKHNQSSQLNSLALSQPNSVKIIHYSLQHSHAGHGRRPN